MKLLQGDCLQLMKDIPDNSIDLILTDPPYLCDYCSHHNTERFRTKIQHDENNVENENMIKQYIAECFRIMKENTAIYCFCNYKKIDFFKQEIEKYFNLKNIIIWDKGGGWSW